MSDYISGYEPEERGVEMGFNWKFWQKKITGYEHSAMIYYSIDQLNENHTWLCNMITPKEFNEVSNLDYECMYEQLIARKFYPEDAA